jgi:Ring finger domain
VICQDDETEPLDETLGCGHSFHRHCLKKWKDKGKKTCPTCRFEFEKQFYRITLTIDPIGFSNSMVSSNVQDIINGLDIDVNFYTSISLSVFGVDATTDLLSSLGLSSLYAGAFDTEGGAQS